MLEQHYRQQQQFKRMTGTKIFSNVLVLILAEGPEKNRLEGREGFIEWCF